MDPRSGPLPDDWDVGVPPDEWPEVMVAAVLADPSALASERVIQTIARWRVEAQAGSDPVARRRATEGLEAIGQALVGRCTHPPAPVDEPTDPARGAGTGIDAVDTDAGIKAYARAPLGLAEQWPAESPTSEKSVTKDDHLHETRRLGAAEVADVAAEIDTSSVTALEADDELSERAVTPTTGPRITTGSVPLFDGFNDDSETPTSTTSRPQTDSPTAPTRKPH